MWKCQRCDLKFETEKELKKHQNNINVCSNCCHIFCDDCEGLEGVKCCQCGKVNWGK